MLAIPLSGRNQSSIIQRMWRRGISIRKMATKIGIMKVSAIESSA